MHDAWGSYFGYGCEHALCNAHHLRELTYLVEREQQEWAQELIDLLVLAYRQVEGAREAGAQELDALTVAGIEEEYRRIVAAGEKANPPVAASTGRPQKGRPAQSKAHNLLVRLRRYEGETLAFVHDFDVPFDNDQAERDLRM